jgi:hypothetical protein
MITKLTRHDSHTVSVHLTKPNSKHYAALRCLECNVHIQWLSQAETDDVKSLGVKTLQPGSSKGVDVYDLFT